MPETRRIRAGRQPKSVNGAAPGGRNRGQAQKVTGGVRSVVDSSEDRRYEVPPPSEREVLEALAVVAAAGYSIAVRCTRCGHPLVTAKSVARHKGPRCASKGVQA